MKKKYIKPIVRIINCNLQPLMIRESLNNSTTESKTLEGYTQSSIDDKESVFSREINWFEDYD